MSRSAMPGNWFCNSAIALAMVPGLTSTNSTSWVSLRSGVGMRTWTAIKSVSKVPENPGILPEGKNAVIAAIAVKGALGRRR